LNLEQLLFVEPSKKRLCVDTLDVLLHKALEFIAQFVHATTGHGSRFHLQLG